MFKKTDEKRITAETTKLYNSFAKHMRDWMLTHPDIPHAEYHIVLLQATAMLSANQIGASAELTGKSFDGVKAWHDDFMEASLKARGVYPSERFD
jgi:hypothetical protein